MGRDLFELIAENEAQAREGGDPEECAQAIEEHEPPHWHAKDSRQRRRCGVQAGYKFRDEQRTSAMPDEKILRSPNARVGFERNAAEQFQYAAAAKTT